MNDSNHDQSDPLLNLTNRAQSGVTSLEQEVLDEYTRLLNNMNHVRLMIQTVSLRCPLIVCWCRCPDLFSLSIPIYFRICRSLFEQIEQNILFICLTRLLLPTWANECMTTSPRGFSARMFWVPFPKLSMSLSISPPPFPSCIDRSLYLASFTCRRSALPTSETPIALTLDPPSTSSPKPSRPSPKAQSRSR